MRLSARLALCAAALLPLPVLQSCVDSAAPGTVATLQISAGDNQAIVPGDTVVLPLDVFAADAGGRPAKQATITWTVTIGNSVVSPVTSVTGVDGHAQALLRAGSAIGEHRVTASAPGGVSVEFRVQVQAPCAYLPSYTIGATATGSFKPTDCQLSDGTPIDFFALDVAATSTIELSMTSTALDPFLFVFDTTLTAVAADDDSGDSLNARVRVLLGPGRYFVGANAFDLGSVGRYEVTSQLLAEEVTPCDVRWVVPSMSSSQTLTGDLCFDPTNQQVVADHWFFVVRPNRPVTVTMNAASFTSRLRLYDQNFALVGEVSSTGPGQAVSIVVSVGTDALPFVIQFGSTTGATGAYSMSLTTP